MDEQIPVIYIARNKSKTVRIKCPYCNFTHKHGRVEGHRLSHCVEEGKLKENVDYDNGYYLRFK